MHYNRNRYKNYLRGIGIEIGALNMPAEVPSGSEVLYADTLTPEQIDELYPGSQHPDILIVEELLPTVNNDSADFLIANHVFEHLSDPISSLIEWHRILRPEAYLVLTIPDKRYIFDHSRPRTKLDHLLNDYHSTEKPHDRDIDHLKEWAIHVEGLEKGSKQYDEWITNQLKQGYSVHNHVWILADILELINYVSKKLKVSFKIIDFKDTPPGDIEFTLLLQVKKQPASLIEKMKGDLRTSLLIIREIGIKRIRRIPLIYPLIRKLKMLVPHK